MLCEEDWNAIEETLYLNSIVGIANLVNGSFKSGLTMGKKPKNYRSCKINSQL